MLAPRVLFAVLGLSAALALPACEDTTEKTQAALIGHWELTKALRNERETGTLEGVFFDFGADGKMLTNLPVGAEQAVEYEVDQTDILQKTPMPVKYRATTLEDSLLVLKMEMRGMTFEMHLKRADVPAADSLSTQPSNSIQ